MIFKGEFDLSCHATLGATLEKALMRDAQVFVDLSGLTFLDVSCGSWPFSSRCTGNVWCSRHPPPKVKVSVAACGMEDPVRFGGSRLEKGTHATA